MLGSSVNCPRLNVHTSMSFTEQIRMSFFFFLIFLAITWNEIKLNESRLGKKNLPNFMICAYHRCELGIDWRPLKRCFHSNHPVLLGKKASIVQTVPFFLIGIHSMQGFTRRGVTRKRSIKRLKHTGNMFKKNLQLKDGC